MFSRIWILGGTLSPLEHSGGDIVPPRTWKFWGGRLTLTSPPPRNLGGTCPPRPPPRGLAYGPATSLRAILPMFFHLIQKSNPPMIWALETPRARARNFPRSPHATTSSMRKVALPMDSILELRMKIHSTGGAT